jgi:DNA (cytosine-5)-methyltransferase 1
LGALAGEDDALIPPRGRWTNAGFIDGPQRAVAWRVLDAQYFGVAQRRRRVFVIASARDDFDPAAVLFEFDGLRRDIAPSREKGKAVASYTPSSFGGYRQETGTLRANGGDLGGGSENLLVSEQLPDVMCTLRASGAGFDRPGNSSTEHETYIPVIVGSLDTECGGGKLTHQSVSNGHLISAPKWWDGGDLAATITTRSDGQRMPDKANAQLVTQPTTDLYNGAITGDVVAPLTNRADGTGTGPSVMQSMAVRRLTPVECERLQGFPDNYTKIADKTPDGPRYKALGNSWAVPVVRWIGERIARAT